MKNKINSKMLILIIAIIVLIIVAITVLGQVGKVSKEEAKEIALKNMNASNYVETIKQGDNETIITCSDNKMKITYSNKDAYLFMDLETKEMKVISEQEKTVKTSQEEKTVGLQVFKNYWNEEYYTFKGAKKVDYENKECLLVTFENEEFEVKVWNELENGLPVKVETKDKKTKEVYTEEITVKLNEAKTIEIPDLTDYKQK